MSLVGLRAAIVADIRTRVTAFAAVQAHGGNFNRTEIVRLATQCPICLVTVLGGPLERQGGQATGPMKVAAFIMTRGTSQTPRDAAAMALAEVVAGLAANNSWKYADAKAPQDMRIDNLYSGDIDGLGVALWSVSWAQYADLAIFDPTDPATVIANNIGEFYRMHAEMDTVPADGVVESEQMIQVGGQFMSAYAHLNIDTAVLTVIAADDTYQKAAGTTGLNKFLNCDMPVVGRARYTGAAAKNFLAMAAVSLSLAGDAKVTLAFAKGGVVDPDSAVEQDCATGVIEALELKHILELDEDEYVEVWVKTTPKVNVTISKMSLVLAAT